MRRALFIFGLMMIGFFADGGRLSARDGDAWQVTLPAVDNGDVNGDWKLDLQDPLSLLSYLYLGGPAPVPLLCGGGPARLSNGDVNGDGSTAMSDAIDLLSWLFTGGTAPAPACEADLAGGGDASSVRIPFSAVLGPVDIADEPADCERFWLSGGQVHLRCGARIGAITGDIEGSTTFLVNINISGTTDDGTLFGSGTIEASWQGLSGAWEFTFSGTIRAGLAATKFVGQGSGGLAGTKIIATSTETGADTNVYVLEGFILNPGG